MSNCVCQCLPGYSTILLQPTWNYSDLTVIPTHSHRYCPKNNRNPQETFHPQPLCSSWEGEAGKASRDQNWPGGQTQRKRLTLSRHTPLFTQGLLRHSSISSSQWTPLKPVKKIKINKKRWLKAVESALESVTVFCTSAGSLSRVSLQVCSQDRNYEVTIYTRG